MTGAPDIFHGKILIVDNQADNVLLLEQMLRGAGYVAISSTTNPTAVRELHRQNRYDLILLDLQMPVMDGFEVMAALKEVELGGEIPVFVLTAQLEHKRRALDAGAKDFLSKPFELDEVLLRVRNWLEARLPRAAAPADAAPPARDVYVIPRTIAWVVGTLAALWLIYRLWKVVLLVVVSLILVGTFNPIVVAMQRRGLKRRGALFVLMLSLGIVAALLIFLSVPALIGQLTTIVHDLPGIRERLVSALEQRPMTTPLAVALGNIELEQSLQRFQAYLVGYWSSAAVVIGYGVSSFSLSIYLLADGKRTQGALYAMTPRNYHMRLARIIHNLEMIVGGYMRGQLITSISLGVYTFVLLAACGVSNALALALFAALMDVLPFIGGVLAATPAVLAALSVGPTTTIVVAVGMWAYLQFENKVLVPRVYGHVLRLSPATVMLSLIAGATLLGVLGALLALPIAAGVRMILAELGVVMPGDDSDDSTARARDQKTEAAYEVMSAGTTAPDAGQIASELAHGLRDADAWVLANEAKKKAAEAGRETVLPK